MYRGSEPDVRAGGIVERPASCPACQPARLSVRPFVVRRIQGTTTRTPLDYISPAARPQRVANTAVQTTCSRTDLFSSIAASLFNRLTYLINYSLHSSTHGVGWVRSSSPMWTNLYIGRSAAIGLPAPLSAPLFLLSAAVNRSIGRRNDLMI